MIYCVDCGSENPEHAKYCYKCGKSIWQPTSAEKPPRQSTSQNPSANDSFIGKTCPYCQAPFKDEVDVVLCRDCNMPHHRDCWAENGNKCTTFGCKGRLDASREDVGRANQPVNNLDLISSSTQNNTAASPKTVPKYDEVTDYQNGIALVKKNGLWGYIDLHGKEFISPQFEDASQFFLGKAHVKKNGVWGTIDGAGNFTRGKSEYHK